MDNFFSETLTKLKLMKATSILIGICIGYYLLIFLYSIFSNVDFTNALVYWGANANYLVYNGEFYRLFTAVLIHGSLIHLFVNMYSLNSIGTEIEYVFGKKNLITIFVVSGLFGNFFSYFLSIWSFSEGLMIPYGISHITVGASGAVFGLLGYLLNKKLNERKSMMEGKFINIEMNSLLIVIVLNILIGFSVPNIDNSAHLAGMIAGFLLAYIL